MRIPCLGFLRDTQKEVMTVSVICYVAICLLALACLIVVYYMRKYKAALAESDSKIEEATQVKDQFLANISHEIRTPLNAIAGLAQILQKTELTSMQERNLKKILGSCDILLSITNEILDFSKIEAGKMQINNVEFELNEILDKVADIMVVSAREKDLELIFNIGEEVRSVMIGDPLRLTQILINLLGNAVKFTSSGSVTLHVAGGKSDATHQSLRFDIIDTGIGLTDEQMDKIFDSFAQADSRTAKKFGGTGLGLTITKELVKMMGGRMDVESTYRQGSTFSVIISFETPYHEDDKQRKLSARLIADKSILILDEKRSASVLAELLAVFDARPKVCVDTVEAERLLAVNEFDAVMIDERYASSSSLIESIKKHSGYGVLLGYSGVKEMDGFAVLNKPVTPFKLFGLTNGLFGKKIIRRKISEKQYSVEDLLVLKGSRVLLVDDNEGNRMVTEGLLEGSGIELIEAENGQRAVEAVLKSSKAFDLILMDINMPVMDGYVATSILREYQKFDTLPIVALTANVTETDIEKFKSYGMQSYLEKPFDVEEFYKMLLQYISPKQSAAVKADKPAKEKKEEVKTDKSRKYDDLVGIDAKAGLARLNGNSVVYEKILDKFADMFENAIVTLQTMLKKGEFKEAADYAHNIKGLSGNIGADTIYDIAKDLDEACRSRSEESFAILKELDKNLTPMINTLKARKAKNIKEVVKKELISPSGLNDCLSALYKAAEENKARAAKKICEELTGYVWPEDKREVLQEVVNASNAYDFNKAKKLIGYLQKL